MDDLLLDALYELIDEIKQKDTYVLYKQLEKTILEKYPLEVLAFNQAKDEYDKALGYGKYYPGIEEVKKRMLAARDVLFEHEEMQRYKALELEIDLYLKELSSKLRRTILG